MSFEDINREIANSGGSYVKLTKKEHGVLSGKILDVKVRDKVFKGKVVPNKNGEPRKEWLFTLETADGIKKWAAVESAQFAIRGALDGRKIEAGGLLQVKVVEDSIQGEKSAEYKALYTSPVDDPFANDAPAETPAAASDDSPF
jgi:hypothetical protein